jgi:regulator of replication initiation timing
MNDINARIQTLIGGLVIENAALKLQIEQLQAQLAESRTTADPKPPPFDQNATS